MPTTAIMQPTYLPWLGYFALMDRVDTFVFLDSVQFERRSWQQRNRIKGPGGPQYLTVPVLSKGRRDQRIDEVVIDASAHHGEKHARAIELNYRKAPHYERFGPIMLASVRHSDRVLADLNIAIITALAQALDIGPKLLRSSQLPVTGSKAELLADICTHLGADTYVSAIGSRAYIDESTAFGDRGIRVTYNDYLHPTYAQQFGSFEPYLSAIDLLLNVGADARDVIRSGIVKSTV